MSLLRETAATKVGAYTQMYGNYTLPSGKVFGFIYVNLSKANNVGDRALLAVGPNIFMPAGDKVEFKTIDDSTDGTVKLDFDLVGAEFDAYPIEVPPFRPRLPGKDVQAPTEEKPWWKQILGWP